MLSADEQLQEALVFPREYLNPSICFPYVSLWMQEPSVFLCRFEEIIGSRGGGSDTKQIEVLTALAQHVGYPKTPKEIQAIVQQLFGGTWTFHIGKIGRWKEEYSASSEELFSRLYGSYLAEWNYDKRAN